MAVKPIPDGFHSVTPYLVVDDPAALIDFMRGAFEAEELERMVGPDGAVMHAEMRIGDSIIMLGQARGESKARPTTLYLYVEDVDHVWRRAIQAGGTSLRPVTDEFYGDRSGGVLDPTGNQWFIATRKEDLTPDELQRRLTAMSQKQGG